MRRKEAGGGTRNKTKRIWGMRRSRNTNNLDPSGIIIIKVQVFEATLQVEAQSIKISQV